MEERWPLFGESKWKNRARDRWLLKGTTRGRLVRHGIARLWWVTNLTYDAHCDYPLSKVDGDPYAYTRAVFRNEDRINALFDREAGAISSVVRSVLEHVGKNAVYGRDNHMRALMKEWPRRVEVWASVLHGDRCAAHEYTTCTAVVPAPRPSAS
jgi:hypothetical protein